ncbi:RDD family protein [Vibrio ruber]|uniref:RDD family protein n=1 Tax=Vibrio ruber TaxID=184755 RepID=UPI002892B79A|nr:RDD family protein [Vibrio ruber]WNJ96240.1 RDD family protein [Vibrio ruber]
MSHQPHLQTAGFIRRIGALVYDTCLILVLEILAAAVIVLMLEAMAAVGLLHYGIYRDVSGFLTHHPFWSSVFTAYLAMIWIGFFVWFWTQKGQTLGMKAWRLMVSNADGTPITITQALIRLFTSGFGLSNLTVPLDPQKRGFHDIWAKTNLYVIPKDDA